jgi:hypothetical protein
MWLEFLITTLVAAGLLAPELRRLALKYGLLLALVVGGGAVMTVSVWLLALVMGVSHLGGPSGTFHLVALLATVVLPLTTFLYVRRRFSVTPSLLPAAFVFVAVAFASVSIAVSLAYSY